jgi:hypothetical protein
VPLAFADAEESHMRIDPPALTDPLFAAIPVLTAAVPCPRTGADESGEGCRSVGPLLRYSRRGEVCRRRPPPGRERLAWALAKLQAGESASSTYWVPSESLSYTSTPEWLWVRAGARLPVSQLSSHLFHGVPAAVTWPATESAPLTFTRAGLTGASRAAWDGLRASRLWNGSAGAEEGGHSLDVSVDEGAVRVQMSAAVPAASDSDTDDTCSEGSVRFILTEWRLPAGRLRFLVRPSRVTPSDSRAAILELSQWWPDYHRVYDRGEAPLRSWVWSLEAGADSDPPYPGLLGMSRKRLLAQSPWASVRDVLGPGAVLHLTMIIAMSIVAGQVAGRWRLDQRRRAARQAKRALRTPRAGGTPRSGNAGGPSFARASEGERAAPAKLRPAPVLPVHGCKGPGPSTF